MPQIAQPTNARSRRTRDSLLHAAREILEQEGFEALTMAHVGDRAGITRRGVYLHFDSVPALVGELFDRIAEVEDLEGSLARVWESDDSASALDAWARHLADYHPRILAVEAAVQRCEGIDRSAAEHRARVSSAQETTCRRLAHWLAEEDRLAPPWTEDTATDLLYGLISTDMMVRLLEDRGWSHAQLAEGLSSLLRSTLAID